MNIIRPARWGIAHHGNIYAESYRNHKREKASGYKGSNPVLRHLAFRDYLIKNKDIAEEYADIKREAAVICQNDARRYSALKEKFIEHHLQLALNDLER